MVKLDKETQKYRIKEFNKIETEYFEYNTKLKLIKPNGETNWIDISNEELNAIKELLTTTRRSLTK